MHYRSSLLIISTLSFLACDQGSTASNGLDMGDAPLSDAAQPSDANPASPEAAVEANTDAMPENRSDMGPDGPVFGEPRPIPERDGCDDTRPPLVLAHGMIGSGDTWAHHIKRFAANGYCSDRYHAFDWNSMNREIDHVSAMESFIDDVLERHGVEQVDLVGHSAGGTLALTLLSDERRARKVRRYIHVGSFPVDTLPAPLGTPVPTLNLWSQGDTIAIGQAIQGATNEELIEEDHYSVATSTRSFEIMYEFLYDAAPEELNAVARDTNIVGGVVKTFAENQPEVGGRLHIWGLDPATGLRDSARRQFAIADDARWGPLVVNADEVYEFEAQPEDENTPTVRYFREAFPSDDRNVYLRTFPGPGSIASILVNLLPTDEASVALVIFNSSGAFAAGRDSLTLDGRELLDENSASAANTSVALFVFDINADGDTGGNSPLFDMFPYLAAIDVPLTPDDSATMILDYNGRTLHLPRAAAHRGILVAVFD